MASFGEFFMGRPARVEQVPRYGNWQQQLMGGGQMPNQMPGQYGQNQMQPGMGMQPGQGMFQGQGMQGQQGQYSGLHPLAQQAQSFYSQQLLPSIAERFNQTGGSITSPAFHSQAHQGAQGISENIAALLSEQQNIPMEAQAGLFSSPDFWKLLASLGIGVGTGFSTGNPAAGWGAGSTAYGLMSGGRN